MSPGTDSFCDRQNGLWMAELSLRKPMTARSSGASGRSSPHAQVGSPMSSFHSSGFCAMNCSIIETHSWLSSTTTSTPRERR